MIGYELRNSENGKSRLLFRAMDFACDPLYLVESFRNIKFIDLDVENEDQADEFFSDEEMFSANESFS